MKRKTITGEIEFSVSSFTIVFESTEKSTSELKAIVDDLVSHNAYAAGLSRVSHSLEAEVIGTQLNLCRYTLTCASFKRSAGSVSADREAIQPSG